MDNARVGIAGEVKGRTAVGVELAHFGMAGLSTRKNIRTARVAAAGIDRTSVAEVAKVAAAGVNCRQIVEASKGAMGIAGNLNGSMRDGLDEMTHVQQRDVAMGQLSNDSNRLGDRAARDAWGRGVWFADFTYITTPFKETENGGHVNSGQMLWRNGREWTFGRRNRSLPLFIDSCGYRRELTGTAPQWAMDFDVYPEAIELIDPDGYAAWDYPSDRQRSLEALARLEDCFPGDDRLWPVFSIRWTWQDKVHLDFGRLPGWASRKLADLIPLTKTQRPFKEATRERWARQAIANALVMAADPDFLAMVERYGRVMIGGMVGCACSRMARHLFAAVLCELFPGVQFWLLGQANFAVINGLGRMGLLDQVWSDGTWWILDSTAERFAVVDEGLITMFSFETNQRRGRGWQKETFFTLTEMMAANLRSLLAAYEGLWSWPPPEPLPVDLLDVEQVADLRQRYQAAQLELGL